MLVATGKISKLKIQIEFVSNGSANKVTIIHTKLLWTPCFDDLRLDIRYLEFPYFNEIQQVTKGTNETEIFLVGDSIRVREHNKIFNDRCRN